jgi:integrase/recombinase XerD
VPTRGAAEPRGFAALLVAYLQELRGRGVSRSLHMRASLLLPRLVAHLKRQGVRDVRSVREEHLVAFAGHLAVVPKKHAPLDARLATGTQNCYLDAVRRFFLWLTKRGVLLENPAHDLPAPKVVRLPRRVLSEAEARRLMNAPSKWDAHGQRDRAVLEVLYGCGLRRGECLRLDVTDLDLGQELVMVRSGKGKKDRMLPLTGQAASALDLYLRESRPELVKDVRERALFLSKYGRRMGPACVYGLLAKHARAAELRSAIFPHALRHTYATHLLKGKASIRHVQELLGHQSLQATAVYTHVGVDDLREVLDRSHPREQLWKRRK